MIQRHFHFSEVNETNWYFLSWIKILFVVLKKCNAVKGYRIVQLVQVNIYWVSTTQSKNHVKYFTLITLFNVLVTSL